MNNRAKLLLLWILLGLPIALVWLVLGWTIVRGVQGLMILTAIAFVAFLVLTLFFYFFSDKLLLRWYHAKEVQDANSPLYKIVHRLAIKAHMAAPKVFVAESVMPNASAIGRNVQHASIMVTNVLLDLLDDDELEAVLAHELAHLKKGETLIVTIVAVVSGALTALASFSFWGAIFTGFGQKDDPAPNLIRFFVTSLVAPVAALLIQLMVSPSRERISDEESVRMIGEPYKLISALEKLETRLKSDTFEVNPSHVHLFFMNPLRDDEFTVMDLHLPTYNLLFHTHPPTRDRINALSVLQTRERGEG